MLLRLSGSDARARAAIEEAAVSDSDAIVRTAAAGALAGRPVQPRKRYQRQQRQHAKLARRS